MTTKVVKDDVLERFHVKRLELEQRFVSGKVEPERALDLMQLALENPPAPCENSSRTYVLESSWAYDNSHREFFTYTLEYCDYMNDGFSFDDLFDLTLLPARKKDEFMERLNDIFNPQVPGHGSRKMIRLYRVLENRCFGRCSHDLNGELERDAVDVHFILKPICDFDDKGEPIPCRMSAAMKKKLPAVPKVGDEIYIPNHHPLHGEYAVLGGKAIVESVLKGRASQRFLTFEIFPGDILFTWEELASQQNSLAAKFKNQVARKS